MGNREPEQILVICRSRQHGVATQSCHQSLQRRCRTFLVTSHPSSLGSYWRVDGAAFVRRGGGEMWLVKVYFADFPYLESMLFLIKCPHHNNSHSNACLFWLFLSPLFFKKSHKSILNSFYFSRGFSVYCLYRFRRNQHLEFLVSQSFYSPPFNQFD